LKDFERLVVEFSSVTISTVFLFSYFVVGGKQDHLLISGCGVPAP